MKNGIWCKRKLTIWCKKKQKNMLHEQKRQEHNAKERGTAKNTMNWKKKLKKIMQTKKKTTEKYDEMKKET